MVLSSSALESAFGALLSVINSPRLSLNIWRIQHNRNKAELGKQGIIPTTGESALLLLCDPSKTFHFFPFNWNLHNNCSFWNSKEFQKFQNTSKERDLLFALSIFVILAPFTIRNGKSSGLSAWGYLRTRIRKFNGVLLLSLKYYWELSHFHFS